MTKRQQLAAALNESVEDVTWSRETGSWHIGGDNPRRISTERADTKIAAGKARMGGSYQTR